MRAPLSAGARVAEPMPQSLVADDPVAADTSTSVVDDSLIVRTGMLELEVGDVATVLALARGEISSLGGYMAGSDEYDQGEQRWANVTYRVPVDRFDEAIDSLRGLADRVVRETTQSQEVTAQVVDLDARIKNLRASEDALVAIMDRAGRIDDVLSVQLRLEDVRRQIEQLTAQRDDLAGRASLATLTAYWTTPVAAVAVAQEGWDFATQVDAALAQTIAALQGLASVLVWVAVVALPLLGVPLLLRDRRDRSRSAVAPAGAQMPGRPGRPRCPRSAAGSVTSRRLRHHRRPDPAQPEEPDAIRADDRAPAGLQLPGHPRHRPRGGACRLRDVLPLGSLQQLPGGGRTYGRPTPGRPWPASRGRRDASAWARWSRRSRSASRACSRRSWRRSTR